MELRAKRAVRSKKEKSDGLSLVRVDNQVKRLDGHAQFECTWRGSWKGR